MFFVKQRAFLKIKRLTPFLQEDETILDVGTGNGGLVYHLQKSGYQINQTIDIKNKSGFHSVQPLIYDGKTFPFPDSSFDCIMIITVLHHTRNPEDLIKEAIRVARKRVIIMEDIYFNIFQKYITMIADSLNNMEIVGHPHSNKTLNQWRTIFEKNGFVKSINWEVRKTLFFFKQVVFELQIKKGESK
jgi:ubiquinone/menaquinone biosynthesis C-methylase UbiE